MDTVKLGRTGVEVPRVSVGTWGHSGAKTVKGMPVGWSGSDDAAAEEALLAAWDAGLTHWDTADAYGNGHSERIIGSLWDRVPREQIFLASKVGWVPGSYGHFYHPELMRTQIEESLRNLQTETIDLYYLHHCDFGPDARYLDDAIDLLRQFRDEGKIRFIGLSDWDSRKIVRFADKVDPDVVQPLRNVLDDTWVSSGLEALVARRNLGVAYFSPLKHGLLLGLHSSPVTFGEGDHRQRVKAFRDPAALAHFQRCREEVTKRFPDHAEPVLHALVGSLLADAPTACVLLGMRRPAHSAAATAVGQPLSIEDARWVRDLYRGTSG